MSHDKWSKSQEARAKILFKLYPKLEEAYNLINSLRAVFRDRKLDKEAAKAKLNEWYGKVTACTLREVKSVRDTIQFYEDEIFNYFIKRQTNASAESLNSKIKFFRSQVKGVSDIPFFMYRLSAVLGYGLKDLSTGFVGCATNALTPALNLTRLAKQSISIYRPCTLSPTFRSGLKYNSANGFSI